MALLCQHTQQLLHLFHVAAGGAKSNSENEVVGKRDNNKDDKAKCKNDSTGNRRGKITVIEKQREEKEKQS